MTERETEEGARPDSPAPESDAPAEAAEPAPPAPPASGPWAPEGAGIVADRRRAAAEASSAAVAAAEARKREAELRGRELEIEAEAAKRRHRLAERIFTWGGGFSALIVAVSLGFVFFGAEAQASYARELLKSLGIALAGGGAFHLLGQAARWLLRR